MLDLYSENWIVMIWDILYDKFIDGDRYNP